MPWEEISKFSQYQQLHYRKHQITNQSNTCRNNREIIELFNKIATKIFNSIEVKGDNEYTNLLCK